MALINPRYICTRGTVVLYVSVSVHVQCNAVVGLFLCMHVVHPKAKCQGIIQNKNHVHSYVSVFYLCYHFD